jgi:hypothetical protein
MKMDRSECQFKPLNLIEHLERGSDSASIVRDLLETSKCDSFYDVKHLREVTEARLKGGAPGIVERLMSFTTDERDTSIINYVVFENKKLFIRELNKTLTWSSWMHYQVCESPNDFYRSLFISAFVGSCAGIFARRAHLGVWTTTFVSGVSASAASGFDRCRKFFIKTKPGNKR